MADGVETEKLTSNDRFDETALERGFSPSVRQTASLAGLDSAFEGKSVTVEHIATAQLLSHDPSLPEDERIEYAKRVPNLINAFAFVTESVILDQYFCRTIPAGVLLREDSRHFRSQLLEFAYFPAAFNVPPDLDKAIWSVRGYYLESQQCRPARSSFLARVLFTRLSSLLSLADQTVSRANWGMKASLEDNLEEGQWHRQVSRRVEKEVNEARIAVEQSLQSEAQQKYFFGMLLGALILGAAVSLLAQWLVGGSFSLTPTVFVAGSVGAVVSAMTRGAKLRVDYRAGRLLLMLTGAFRPIVGGVFGLALYIFIEGTLLPIEVTAAGTSRTFFYLGIAFLAGFSERFAQDAITLAGSSVSDLRMKEATSQVVEGRLSG